MLATPQCASAANQNAERRTPLALSRVLVLALGRFLDGRAWVCMQLAVFLRRSQAQRHKLTSDKQSQISSNGQSQIPAPPPVPPTPTAPAALLSVCLLASWLLGFRFSIFSSSISLLSAFCSSLPSLTRKASLSLLPVHMNFVVLRCGVHGSASHGLSV